MTDGKYPIVAGYKKIIIDMYLEREERIHCAYGTKCSFWKI